MRVAIYNSLWTDISRFFMVDLIDSYHFQLMENVNEDGKERDGPLVFPGYSLHDIPCWDYRVYNKLIVIFYKLKLWNNYLARCKGENVEL